mmetsp:Transcript_5634/g.5833  ORF Transcript_5634/g.5833 Transcript_5634/m.5833 type:complete len:254 (+) Transcript_5634:80-841(+)
MAFQQEEEPVIEITAQEERELRRVFELLCDFQRKSKINEEIHSIQGKRKLLAALSDNTTAQFKEDEHDDETKMAELRKELNDLEIKSYKKVTCADVYTMLKFLKQKTNKKDVEEMLWEVDEDLDQCLDWSEFRKMFTRNAVDRTGLEMSKMFNLTQFLIYDHNCNGKVSVDETMNMLYARYGRVKMETKLKELFGENMHENGRQGGEISFAEYLRAVERIQLQTFWGSTKGRMSSTKGGQKPLLSMTSTTSSA